VKLKYYYKNSWRLYKDR